MRDFFVIFALSGSERVAVKPSWKVIKSVYILGVRLSIEFNDDLIEFDSGRGGMVIKIQLVWA